MTRSLRLASCLATAYYFMLAPTAFSQNLTFDQLFARLRAHNISGASIITHGYQFSDSGGDSLMSIATAIRNRIIAQSQETVWLVDYDIADDGLLGSFDAAQSILPAAGSNGQTGHVVFLMDWAPESNRSSRWWAESAGDALFAMMAGTGVIDPRMQRGARLHMLAHSFGSGVTSEAIERMAAYEIPVANLTYLDPHDFDQADISVDESQRIFDLGKPTGYGASVWDNVEFADSYYQTRGAQAGIGTAGTKDPEGRPIPGAFNRHLDGAEELPAGNPYSSTSFYESDHGYAWETFYRSTIDGARPGGTYAPAVATNYAQTGWAYSIHNTARIARPAPNFYGAGQDHEHSSTALVTAGAPNAAGLQGLGITQEQVVDGRWAPSWTPDQIANGNFSAGHYSDLVDDVAAGWSHHGGGEDGDVNDEAGGSYLRLNLNDDSRRHNYLYIPLNATGLQFDNRIWDESSNDVFRVRIGDTVLGTIDVTQRDQTWRARTLAIPQALRNTVQTITFETLADGALNIVDSEIDIDNVRFGIANPKLQTSLMPGSTIDFGNLRPNEMKTLAQAVSLSNIGDAGSILDYFFNEDMVIQGLPLEFTLTGAPAIPVPLTAGQAAHALDAKFLGSMTMGLHQTDVTLRTSVGSVTYRLQAMVVPEPGEAILAVALCVAVFKGRSRTLAPRSRESVSD